MTTTAPEVIKIPEEILQSCTKPGRNIIEDWQKQEAMYNSTTAIALVKKSALAFMAFLIKQNTDPSKNNTLINAVTQAITDPNMQTKWQECLPLPFFASKKTVPAAKILNKEISIDFEPFTLFEQVINRSSIYLPEETRDIIYRLANKEPEKEPEKEPAIIKKINAFINLANEKKLGEDLDEIISKIYEDLGEIFGEDVFKQELLTALKALIKTLPPEAATAISNLIEKLDLEKIHKLIVTINKFKQKSIDNRIVALYEQINEIIGKDAEDKDAFKEQLWSLLEGQIKITADLLKDRSQSQAAAILENIRNTVSTVHTAAKTIQAGDLKIIQKAIDLIKDFNGYTGDEDNDLDLDPDPDLDKALGALEGCIANLFKRWIPKQAEEARQPVYEVAKKPLVIGETLIEPQKSQAPERQDVLNQIPEEAVKPIIATPPTNPKHAGAEISQKYQKKSTITAEASTGKANTDTLRFRQMSYTTLNKAQELMALTGRDKIFNKIKEVQDSLGKKFVEPESNDFINIFKQLELACMKTSVDLERGIHKKTSDTYLQAYQDKVKNIINKDIARNNELFNEATEFYFYMYSVGMPLYGYSQLNDEKKIKRVCNT